MLVAVCWFSEEGLVLVSVDGEDASSSLLKVDGFRVSYKCLAIVAFGPLVIRWREARCSRSTSAGRWASCSRERPLTSAGGVPVDDDGPRERRVDDERLVFSIVGSEKQ